MTAQRILLQHRLYQHAEALEAGTQIGGSRSQIHFGGRARAQHGAPPSTTRRAWSAALKSSVPGGVVNSIHKPLAVPALTAGPAGSSAGPSASIHCTLSLTGNFSRRTTFQTGKDQPLTKK